MIQKGAATEAATSTQPDRRVAQGSNGDSAVRGLQTNVRFVPVARWVGRAPTAWPIGRPGLGTAQTRLVLVASSKTPTSGWSPQRGSPWNLRRNALDASPLRPMAAPSTMLASPYRPNSHVARWPLGEFP
jgi:hypothetical protein